MKRLSLITAAAAALGVAGAFAQPAKVDVGKRDYQATCAVCHGSDGRGNGPYASYLKTPAADLTTLAKRNAGVFPLSRVVNVIDGGDAAHGAREMPVWGPAFRADAAQDADGRWDMQGVARARVLALAEYLSRLQPK